MRLLVGLAAIVAFGACAPPTGTAQTWPPSLGVTVAAASLVDLDHDSVLDLAIAATGGAAGEGLYLVRGDTDWDGAAISSFTRFVPHALADVAALELAEDTLALAYTVKGTATLETLDRATLATLSTTQLAIASKQRLAIASLGTDVAVLGDNDVVRVDLANPSVVTALPPPTGATWPQPQAALGFGAGLIAIATPAQVYVAAAGAMTYTTVRPTTDTVALTAQTPVALTTTNGTPITAFVGIDVAGQRLCAIDVTAATGAVCFAISISQTARFAIVSGVLDPMKGTDISVVESRATDTVIVTYTNVALDGAILTSDSPTGAGGAHIAVTSPIVRIVPGVPPHLFALGIDGQTACLGMTDC